MSAKSNRLRNDVGPLPEIEHNQTCEYMRMWLSTIGRDTVHTPFLTDGTLRPRKGVEQKPFTPKTRHNTHSLTHAVHNFGTIERHRSSCHTENATPSRGFTCAAFTSGSSPCQQGRYKLLGILRLLLTHYWWHILERFITSSWQHRQQDGKPRHPSTVIVCVYLSIGVCAWESVSNYTPQYSSVCSAACQPGFHLLRDFTAFLRHVLRYSFRMHSILRFKLFGLYFSPDFCSLHYMACNHCQLRKKTEIGKKHYPVKSLN